jgi:hypothetical protein
VKKPTTKLMARKDRRVPLVVAYGMGVDSTAMLVGMRRRGIRPDLILFADTGGEKPETYDYLPVIQRWLRKVGFPPVQIVRYVPKWTKRGHYTTLEENCLVNETLPSLAFGRKACSLKWKRAPQDKFVRQWEPAQETWAQGKKVVKAIGYDAGPADMKRGHKLKDDEEYVYWYPLREWGITREKAEAVIRSAGLPVPVKSACFYCPASKPHEIAALCKEHPDLATRIKKMEKVAGPRLRVIEGLWRKATKARPGDMSTYIDECRKGKRSTKNRPIAAEITRKKKAKPVRLRAPAKPRKRERAGEHEVLTADDLVAEALRKLR